MMSYPDSYYAASVQLPPPRASLGARLRAEAAVIGCGYTGISAALHLAESGKRVVALEAGRVAVAASGRNGGQLHSGFNLDQSELEQTFGRDRAVALWTLADRAKGLVRERVRR